MLVVQTINLGPPVPKDELHMLFKPYQKLRNSRQKEGNGLGLYITKKIIEGLNGTIEHAFLESRETQFEFRVPCLRYQN